MIYYTRYIIILSYIVLYYIKVLKEVKDLLRSILSKSHLVGLDLVEVSPPYDPAQVTSTLAARLLLDAMGFARSIGKQEL